MVPAVAHLRDRRAAAAAGDIQSAAQWDPLRASLPDMKLGPRALTCNHMMHYQCYLSYSCESPRPFLTWPLYHGGAVGDNAGDALV